MESYGVLLKTYRQTRGVSQRALARAMKLNPTLINRSEAGQRPPSSPEEIADVARVLQLTGAEHDTLLASSGYWPAALTSLGPGDPTLQAVATTLADPSLPAGVGEEVRRAIAALLRVVALSQSR